MQFVHHSSLYFLEDVDGNLEESSNVPSEIIRCEDQYGLRIDLWKSVTTRQQQLTGIQINTECADLGNFTACAVYTHFSSSSVNPHGGNCFTGE